MRVCVCNIHRYKVCVAGQLFQLKGLQSAVYIIGTKDYTLILGFKENILYVYSEMIFFSYLHILLHITHPEHDLRFTLKKNISLLYFKVVT